MPAIIRNYLRLCRIPTICTAMADIFAAFLLTSPQWSPAESFTYILLASICLYLSGMVFNDVFDVEIDKVERPNRPIPSGAISLRNAITFGVLLMGLGLAFAWNAGFVSFQIAIMTCVAILLYDGGLKRTVLGPLAMGSCRFFNILLGASTTAVTLPEAFAFPKLWFALSMLVYISGVTWFARKEAVINRSRDLIPGLIILNIGLVMLAVWILNLLPRFGLNIPFGMNDQPQSAFVLLAVVAVTINRRAIAAIMNPQPQLIQVAVGGMLLSLISLNACVIYSQLGDAGIPYAVFTLALIIPAFSLRRLVPMT